METSRFGSVVAFSFMDGLEFVGFTDGTRWNGFANVRVNGATHLAVREHLGRDDWEDSGFSELQRHNDDLFDYSGGFACEDVALDTITTERLGVLIGEQQEVQKRNRPQSDRWIQASLLLAPLFAEMARR